MSLPFPMGGAPYWLVNSILGIDAGVCSQDQLHQALQLQYSSNQEASSSSICGVIGVPQSMACSEFLASELEKQRPEMDWLLQLENQELRTAVQETTRQQAVLLERYESRIINLMRQKEQDLETSRNRSVELQNFLVRAEVEAQAWKKKALDNEAMVLDLNNRLDVVRETNLSLQNGAQDAESFSDPSIRDCRNQEQQSQFKRMTCKFCNARRQCVVFLPCRHLCSCRACESLLALCPVCESVKQASMEVLLVKSRKEKR